MCLSGNITDQNNELFSSFLICAVRFYQTCSAFLCVFVYFVCFSFCFHISITKAEYTLTIVKEEMTNTIKLIKFLFKYIPAGMLFPFDAFP